MDVTTRLMQEADKAVVYEMFQDLYDILYKKGFFLKLNEKPIIMGIIDKILKSDFDKIILAEVDNEVVGFTNICISQINKKFKSDSFILIGNVIELYIKEKFRNKKIGSKLLLEAEQYFNSYEINIIQVSTLFDNDAAIDFYERHNYVIDSVTFTKSL